MTKKEVMYMEKQIRNALFLTATLSFASGAQTPAASHVVTGNVHWVGTWATAPHQPDLGVPGLANQGFANQTIRQIVHTSVEGHQVRVRLSAFGSNGLAVSAAHIAIPTVDAAILPETDRVLTFGGAPSITIPAGALVLSDPVNLNVPAFTDLAISIYTSGPSGPATWHFEARQLSYVSTPGDFTASVNMPVAASVPAWFWIAGVEVATNTDAVVAIGESLTDGTQSTVGANHRWPDYLAQRLIAAPGRHATGVLNLGIAGSRMLHDSLGPNALSRFDRDVLAQPGVTYVVVQMGQNDIFTVNPSEEPTVDQVIQAHRQLIERAHERGLKIYVCTMTPNEGFLLPGTSIPVFTVAKEVTRQAVNEWIRTSSEYDAVIDFDMVLRDPSHPSRILPAMDSGDHGHPTDAGYKALAAALDLRLFQATEDNE
jgi:lysophospholipase L1-like esterase